MPEPFTMVQKGRTSFINMEGWPSSVIVVLEEPYAGFSKFVEEALNHLAEHKIERLVKEAYTHEGPKETIDYYHPTCMRS